MAVRVKQSHILNQRILNLHHVLQPSAGRWSCRGNETWFFNPCDGVGTVQWQWNVVVEGCMGQSGLQKVPPTPSSVLRAACTEEGTSTEGTSETSQHTGKTHNQQAQPQVSS